ncbi:MAG: sensor histidine kinase [Turicibacter sp.]
MQKQFGLFGKTKIKLMWMSLGIISLSLVIFSVVVTMVFQAVVFEEVDDLMGAELSRIKILFGIQDYSLYKSSETQLNSTLSVEPSYYQNLQGITIIGDIGTYPQAGDSIITAEVVENPRVMSFVYYGDTLVYQSNSLYFSQDENLILSIDSTNGMVNFKSNGFNFRGQTQKVENFSFQTIVNVDSEMSSIQSLYRVIIVSFICLIFINIWLVQKLIRIVLKPIEKSYQSQTQFIQDVSHEIRTPLTVMKGQVERLLQKSETQVSDHFQTLAEMMTEITGIERMQRDLLILSKVDVDKGIDISSVMVSKLVEDLKELYDLISEYESKSFIIHNLKSELWITTDETKLKHCLRILLDNAFKYTMENDLIEIVIEEQPKDIVFKIIDTGIGIDEEEQSRIFDRFYRSHNEKIQNIEGSGIGLAILKAYCDLLHYKIEVSSTIGEGTTFALIIPKKI